MKKIKLSTIEMLNCTLICSSHKTINDKCIQQNLYIHQTGYYFLVKIGTKERLTTYQIDELHALNFLNEVATDVYNKQLAMDLLNDCTEQ